MSYHYCILKVSVNQDLNDTFSIGLLLLAGDRYWFKYSQDKVKYLKPFLGNRHLSLIKILKIISRKIETVEGFQLDLYSDLNEFFTKEFLEQLHHDHIGMIRFSEPTSIVLTSVNKKVFDDFYKSIIGEDARKVKRKKNPEIGVIDRKLIKPLSNVVHTHVVLDGKKIPELYFRYELEAIGKDDEIYIAKYLDFNQTPPTLDMKIMRLLFLSRLLSQVYRTKVRVFVIASEPPMLKNKRHSLYDFVVRNENLEVKTPDECPQVANIFAEAEMRKFLK